MEAPKTKQSYRKVQINSECRQYLHEQLELKAIVSSRYPNDDCPYLFTSTIYTPIEVQMYNDAIGAAVKCVNYRRGILDMMTYFTGHTFRHTFATRCFEAGIPPKVVQKYLGHATLQMTMDLYTHVTEEKAQGMNTPNAKEMAESLTDLPLILINTHADPDHISGNGAFEEFYMSLAEEENYRQNGGKGTILPVRLLPI